MEKSKTLVTGLMSSRFAAESAIKDITSMGYSGSDVSVLMSDRTKAEHFAIETGTKAAEGGAIGAGIGGTVGAVIAAIAAAGTSLILPGLGLVVAGPLAAAFAGAGAGAATGGLVGTLVGAGIPEHRAKAYEDALKAGGILLGVVAKNGKDADLLEKVLARDGARDVKSETMSKTPRDRDRRA